MVSGSRVATDLADQFPLLVRSHRVEVVVLGLKLGQHQLLQLFRWFLLDDVSGNGGGGVSDVTGRDAVPSRTVQLTEVNGAAKVLQKSR